MKERPILFSGAMIRAIREGRKTQTRRVVKLPVKDPQFGCEIAGCELNGILKDFPQVCPYGKPGDQLWVRETWRMDAYNIAAEYRATISALMEHIAPWKPSIFMPRWASRITLEIVSVRVEQLQDISEEDAKAEGYKPDGFFRELDKLGLANKLNRLTGVCRMPSQSWFLELWESINGPGSWDANPWVWCVEFKEVTR